jgi:hypothetical protein
MSMQLFKDPVILGLALFAVGFIATVRWVETHKAVLDCRTPHGLVVRGHVDLDRGSWVVRKAGTFKVLVSGTGPLECVQAAK